MSANAQYNGNIAGIAWNVPQQSGTLSPGEKEGYGFTYDGLNRMTGSAYGEGSSFATNTGANDENLTYDKNGNILTLTRNLKGDGINTINRQIDQLTYTYKNGDVSNMLDRVDDAVSGTEGFSEYVYPGYVQQSNEYGYDYNGNLTSDANKGYNSIQYNYLNLPKRIEGSSQYILYIYDAAGTKLAKVGTGGVYTYYAGSFVYSGSSLSYILTREGMYLPGGNYQYYLKDHLGNTRLAVNTVGAGGTVVQQTDYYPFGMDIACYNGGLDNKYRYNGKEFQDDMIGGKSLGWYDYGARFYDPTIGRWNSVDPMAEKSRRYSPYNYCVNNPLRFVDPDGMLTDDYKIDRDNVVKKVKDTSSQTDELYATKKDGSIDKSKVISVTKGTFDKKTQSKNGKTKGFQTSNVQDATNVFKFAADNSTKQSSSNPIEFAIISFNQDGVSQAAVVTSGQEAKVGANSIAVALNKEGASIQSIGHNHPSGSRPSGYTGNLSAGVPNGKNEGDYDAYMKIGGRSVESFVYSSQNNWIYNYDKTGYIGYSSSVGF